jgi:AraC-like DNA-binding protein
LVSAGDVLLHEAFEAHSDRFGSRPTRILNINLRPGTRFSRGKVTDVDKIARLAESDLGEAREVLLVEMRQGDREGSRDWPDLLAHALWTNSALRISDWAEEHGLAPETVSRGFRRAFGTTPARFRSSVRARKAWRLLADGTDSLSDVAQIAGFADQAHMTRSIVALTGVTPTVWRGLRAR